MYRLLNVKSHLGRNFGGFSVNFPNDFKVRIGGACFGPREAELFCKGCARLQSGVANANARTSKQGSKQRAKTKKKYYDLLVVTENSSKQKRTQIKKLTWDDIKLLANTSLNLSELHKIKNPQYVHEHTYNNLTVIDEYDALSVRDINLGTKEPAPSKDSEQEVALAIETILEDPLNTTDIPVKVDNFRAEELVADESIEEVEINPETPTEADKSRAQKARNEVACKFLGSYLEICSNLKIPHKGLAALVFHNNRADRGNDKYFTIIKDIDVYNALVKGFAKQGDITKLQEVLGFVKEANIKPNIQTYIAIFECLGRINVKNSYLKEIRIYGKEAWSHGFTFDKIINEGVFLNDEREIVLKAMKSYDPNYMPKYEKPVLQYNNHLVNHLNNDTQLFQPTKTPEDPNKAGGMFTREIMQERIRKQLDLEREGYVTVRSIEARGEVGEEVTKYRETLADLFKTWEETAYNAFIRDLKTLTAQRSPLNHEIYLRSLPVKDFVRIIVDEARKIAEGSESYSPTTILLYRDLGHKVYARFKVIRKQRTGVLDKVLDVHSKFCEDYAARNGELGVVPSERERKQLNTRQLWQWCEYELKNRGATLSMDHREWNPSILQSIGKFLYTIVMHDLKVDVNSMRTVKSSKNFLPAFYTVFRTQGRLVKEEVKPHPILSKLYRASMPETLTFPTYELPMVCPPVPWTGVDNGGYLVSSCDVVRLPSQASCQKLRLASAGPQQLYPSLDALNQLAAVPWKVNKKILDVILDVFKNGGSDMLDVPEPPSSLTPPQQITADLDKTAKFNLFRMRLQYRRKKAEMYSLWCDCLYRLSLANHFRDDIFWLPHNMDFRGRVYPVPPHLNHLGSDLARSILVFAESRPLGPQGLDWLKIHLINLTGLKKRDSVTERLKYADEIMDDILDSADYPLTGRKWWAESEEPWQTLACCMEIAAASRSEDPTKFHSHFPVHQDGSCNGLQHYAALGRDSTGAYSVNLVPSETPQDVYSAVVALVEEQRAKDAANGLEVAKMLDGFVKRKVIKQTIMTTVYGVTRFGARLQIARQLKDIDAFPKDSVWAASAYLTGRTFDSLRSMFTSTREIQDWFTDCARLISAVSGQQVEWVTPMGLPIVQPYFRHKTLSTSQSLLYKQFHMDQFEKPNVMKQKNAFPPNFIHSLDSSHMMLTSLHCEREGITFVSVHDCYWTHPSTVQIMNKICREQFVALHSEPILENLSRFLCDKFSYDRQDFKDDGSVLDMTKRKLNKMLRKLPKTGDFDINHVLKSIYFFS